MNTLGYNAVDSKADEYGMCTLHFFVDKIFFSYLFTFPAESTWNSSTTSDTNRTWRSLGSYWTWSTDRTLTNNKLCTYSSVS